MARPYHFTTDPESDGWTVQFGSTTRWTQSGTLETCSSGGNNENDLIYDSDVSINQTVHTRFRLNGSGSLTEAGVMCNWVDVTHNYLIYNQDGKWTIALYNGGYSELANYVQTVPFDGTYIELKAVTVTNGSNKDITLTIDDVVLGTASTATIHASSKAGLFANSVAAGRTIDFDWWAFNTVITVSSVSPSSGPTAGGTAVTITGSDIGDGALGYIGSSILTGIATTPNTTMTGTTPSGSAGDSNVTIKFGTLGSEEYTGSLSNGFTYLPTLTSLIAKSRHSIFRRLHIKRRQNSGEYESSWQEVPSKYIGKWGRIKNGTDNIVVGEYQQSGVQLTLRNDDGYFNGESELDSNWYGYYSRYRTLVRVQAGYYDADLNEYPTDSTMFTGIINSDFDQTSKNDISIQVDSLDSVFKEVPASSITFPNITTTALRADQIIAAIQNFTDGSNNLVFQKFIPLADWTITTGTITYPGFNTTTVFKSDTAWSIIQKLAQAENKVAYISPTGKFYFESRPTTTASTTYELKGLGAGHSEYGHNIIEIESQIEAVSKVYNRVRVKYLEADTETSYYTRAQTWGWGDGSTSDKYGVRTYNLDNQMIGDVTQATSVGDAIFNEFSALRQEVKISCKFLPQLFLGNVSLVTYQDASATEVLWGTFMWGYANWADTGTRGAVRFYNDRFQILSVEHDLDNIKTILHLRMEA